MKRIEFRKLFVGGAILVSSVFITVQYQNCSPNRVDFTTLNHQIIQKNEAAKLGTVGTTDFPSLPTSK